MKTKEGEKRYEKRTQAPNWMIQGEEKKDWKGEQNSDENVNDAGNEMGRPWGWGAKMKIRRLPSPLKLREGTEYGGGKVARKYK